MNLRNGLCLASLLACSGSLHAAQEGHDPCEGLLDQEWRSCLSEQASKPVEYSAATREHLPRSNAYARRLAQSLARSPQARDKLLAAKLLQLPSYRVDAADAAAIAKVPQSDALLREALRLGRDDTLVQWVIASGELARTTPQLKAAAIANLRRLQPDNLAAWLLFADGASSIDAATLAKAAAASHHDMAYDQRLAWYAGAHLANLPDEGAPSGSPDFPDLDREQFALVQALGLWLAGAWPSYAALSNTCKPGAAGYTAVTAEDCRRIARVLVAQSDTIIAMRIGLAIGERVALGESEMQLLRRQRRDLDWQTKQYGQLFSARPLSEYILDDLRVRVATPGMTELRHMREKILAADGTLQAPEDWVSGYERRRQAGR